MKTNIKYSIVQLLFWLLGFSISLIGFIVLLTDINAVDTILWVVVAFGVLSLSFLVMLLISINNIQWFYILNEYIVVRSPFGIVKRVLISDIKKAFKTKVSIFHIKMTSINRMHIVLCLKKSLTLRKNSRHITRLKCIPITTASTTLKRAWIWKSVTGSSLLSRKSSFPLSRGSEKQSRSATIASRATLTSASRKSSLTSL